MSNKIFSLCFAVAMLSNVGYVLSKKESKDLWWDAEVEMEDQRLMKLEEEALRREEKKEKARLKKMHAKEQYEEKKAKKAAMRAEKMKKKQEKKAEKEIQKKEKKSKKELSKKNKPKKAPYLKKKKKDKKSKEKHLSKDKSNERKKKCKAKKKKRSSHCGPYVSFAMEEKKERMREERAQREELMANWAEKHELAVKQDYENGRYADLYKLSSWPKWAHYFHQQNYAGVRAYYTHADDAYNSCGVNQDVSVLHFGHEPVRLRDMLLVSHLVSCELAEHADLLPLLFEPNPIVGSVDNNQQVPGRYFEYLANSVIDFKSRVESYGMDLNFSHYIYGRSVAVGIHIPVLYKKHRVNAHMIIKPTTVRDDNSSDLIKTETVERICKFRTDLEKHTSLNNEGNPDIEPATGRTLVDLAPNAFLRRYGNNTQLFIKDILQEKCFDQMGGSAAGLGDVSLYINAQITSLLFDRAVVGFRAKLPTGKEASPFRLWGPGLGTGLTELSVYSALQLSHSKMCNPHAFMEASFGLLGHVEKRVPRRHTLTDDEASARREKTNFTDRVLSKEFEDLSFADRVYTRPEEGFSLFDSRIAALSDYVTTVRMAKGFQIDLMLGNVIEEFISRRGFFDMYYKLKIKWKDRVSQPDLQMWNAQLLWENSQSIAHTLGCEYSYQHDLNTRCKIGMQYIVAGKSAPKEFGIDWSIDHSF